MIIETMAVLDNWISKIQQAGVFAFNIKTDGLDVLTAKLMGFCFAVKPGIAAYLPIRYDHLETPNQLNCNQILTVMKPILENPFIDKIGHNLKFDYGVLKRYNIELTGVIFDTMLESYMLNGAFGRHDDINSLAKRFLQHTTVELNKIVNKDCNQFTLNQRAIDQTASYAVENINVILRLHQTLWPCIERVSELKRIFKEIDMPLVSVLSRVECTGVLIDKSILIAYSAELAKRMKELTRLAYQLAEEPFNLSSTKQLQTILYNKQKLPVLKKTNRGVPATDEEVLTALAIRYPLPKLILEYRSLSKLKSTYTDKLLKMINPLSERIHTSYHQAITITGRLSSSEPNLQNIPIRNDKSRRIRQAFIAPVDSFLISADYSQIELRIMAHLSNDSELLKVFTTGQDIHCITAAEVFGVSPEKVTHNQRRSAKAINFGLIYGISNFGLSHQLSVSKSEAQKYMNLYFDRYPGILQYMEYIRKQADNQGYVKTLDGRRLYLPHIHSRNAIHKKSAERTAINAVVQGTAADIIKRAMISIDKWLQQEAPPVRMIMQVHDELVFEVQRYAVEDAKSRIKALMEHCFQLDVPLKVDIGVGDNWDQAH